MKKARIYLETTMFNFYVDKERDHNAATVRLFENIKEGKYEAFTSNYVVDELLAASEPKRSDMLGLIKKYDIAVLAPSAEAARLAQIYVEQGMIPERYKTDALHIAIATVNDLDIIFSMNFQHIVKRKTRFVTGNINLLNGYRSIEILPPMED